MKAIGIAAVIVVVVAIVVGLGICRFNQSSRLVITDIVRFHPC